MIEDKIDVTDFGDGNMRKELVVSKASAEGKSRAEMVIDESTKLRVFPTPRSGLARSRVMATAVAMASAMGGIALATSEGSDSLKKFDKAARDSTQARSTHVQKAAPNRTPTNKNQTQSMMKPTANSRARSKTFGTGWPVATDRRRAKKTKNVARNRAAHR